METPHPDLEAVESEQTNQEELKGDFEMGPMEIQEVLIPLIERPKEEGGPNYDGIARVIKENRLSIGSALADAGYRDPELEAQVTRALKNLPEDDTDGTADETEKTKEPHLTQN